MQFSRTIIHVICRKNLSLKVLLVYGEMRMDTDSKIFFLLNVSSSSKQNEGTV